MTVKELKAILDKVSDDAEIEMIGTSDRKHEDGEPVLCSIHFSSATLVVGGKQDKCTINTLVFDKYHSIRK